MSTHTSRPGPTQRTCPQCGANYENHVSYCFVDGAPLVDGPWVEEARRAQWTARPLPQNPVPPPPPIPAALPAAAPSKMRLGWGLAALLGAGISSSMILAVIAGFLASGGAVPRTQPPTPAAPTKPANDNNTVAQRLIDESERLVAERNLGVALQLLEQASALKPTDPDVVIRLARRTSETSRSLHLESAAIAITKRDFEVARSHLERVLEGSPSDPKALELQLQLQQAIAAARPRPAAPAAAPPDDGLIQRR